MSKNIEHIQHIKSNVVIDGKPKLPIPSVLVEGELAINYAEGVETISIKNESGDVVTFSSDEYYTEQKLGDWFTGANSAKTVTDIIEENEEIVSAALNDLETKKLDISAYTVEQSVTSETSASTNPISTIGMYNFVTSYTPGGTIDQTIDSGTSASTNAVSTSAVYGFVTSYTPSINVDQVLDDTTSASTNPVSSKAAYKAITDNELVWTNAYRVISGDIAAHSADTTIHVTSSDKSAWDNKAEIVHSQASNTISAMTGYEIAASGTPITSGDTLNQAIGKLEKMIDEFKEYIEIKEQAIAAALTDLDNRLGNAEEQLSQI